VEKFACRKISAPRRFPKALRRNSRRAASRTYLTVQAAKIDLGPWNIVLALTIATIKMSLVILFFMHGKYSPKRTQLVIISGFFWLAIMLGLTLTDYTARKPEPSRSANPSAAVIHRA